MDTARQFYLEGFEGCNLSPDQQRMVQAYVNGVDGEEVDNLGLCKMIGSRVRNVDTARTTIWKIFNGKSPSDEHKAMREYARWLQSRNLAKSDMDAAAWREKVHKMILMSEGVVPQRRVFSASHKGYITVKEALVNETNITGLGQGLRMYGEHIGTLKADADTGDAHEDWVAKMQPSEVEEKSNDQ